MKKNKECALQTREYLIDAALEMFYQKGVARTTLEQIAKAAGVTRGAIYWHFKNKADIFDAVCQRYFLEVDSFSDQILSRPPQEFWLAFESSIMKFYQDMATNEILQKFFSVLHLRCEYTDENRAIVALLTEYRSLWEEQCLQIILYGIECGHLNPSVCVDELNFFIRSSLLGITVTWLADPVKLDIVQHAKLTTRILVNTLQTKNDLFINS